MITKQQTNAYYGQEGIYVSKDRSFVDCPFNWQKAWFICAAWGHAFGLLTLECIHSIMMHNIWIYKMNGKESIFEPTKRI